MADFNDALRKTIDARLAEIHVAMPARVEAYDPSSQKATVKPLLKKKLLNGLEVSLSVMEDVPVIMPRSALGSLTLPIANGDTVLLVFAERAIDTWLSLGGEQTPGDPRKFDLSDAVAIPGLYPFNVPGHGTSDAVLLECNNSAKVKLTKDGKVAVGTSAIELLDVLSQTLQALATATVPSGGGPLSNAATYATLQAQLDSIKGTL